MQLIPRSVALVALVAAATLATPARSAPLIPGAILSVGYEAPEMRQYSKTGTLLDSFPIIGLNRPTGVALIGNTVWVTGRESQIGTLDMTTGVFLLSFDLPNIVEGLANIGSDLLLLNEFGSVERRTTVGAFVSSFPLSGIGVNTYNGLDTDGNNAYVANFTTGVIETYTLAGAFSSSFNTGLGGDVLSGLAYDDSDGTLWVGKSDNTGTPEVLHYTTGGTLLGAFPVPILKANGLEVVPGFTASAPEPGSLALLALGTVAGGMVVRRRRNGS